MKQMRLLLWEDCHRNCIGCCNQDWDIDNLPNITSPMLHGQDIVMLTGGEPLLYPSHLFFIIDWIRATTDAKIYLYTSKTDDIKLLNSVLTLIDGVTITLHEQSDVKHFTKFTEQTYLKKSYRLNIFKGISIDNIPTEWVVKKDIEWIVNCPLPKNEIFVKYG